MTTADDSGARPPRSLGVESALVGLLATALVLAVSRLDSSVYDNFVLLADAFVHRHVWIDWPGSYIDALGFGGAHYVIEGPLPAILLMPFVAIFGVRTNQTAFTCVFAGIMLGAAWYLARTFLRDRLGYCVLVVAFMALGTDVVWCSMYGAVWFTAHIVADAFLFLALVELVGRKRPWLVLLLVLLASEARFAVVLAAPALVAYALSFVSRDALLRAAGACALVVAPFAVWYVAYDLARWGVWYDIGYTQWYHQDQIGEPTGSPFRLSYVPSELDAFFAHFPRVIDRFPYVIVSTSSVPLTVTTPALLLAFFARGSKRLVAALGAAALLTFLPNVTYYANGAAQFGMRHALDFEPFLFVLVVLAFASRRVPRFVGEVLTVWSIAVGIWGIWFWRTYYDDTLVHHIPGINA